MKLFKRKTALILKTWNYKKTNKKIMNKTIQKMKKIKTINKIQKKIKILINNEQTVIKISNLIK